MRLYKYEKAINFLAHNQSAFNYLVKLPWVAQQLIQLGQPHRYHLNASAVNGINIPGRNVINE